MHQGERRRWRDCRHAVGRSSRSCLRLQRRIVRARLQVVTVEQRIARRTRSPRLTWDRARVDAGDESSPRSDIQQPLSPNAPLTCPLTQARR